MQHRRSGRGLRHTGMVPTLVPCTWDVQKYTSISLTTLSSGPPMTSAPSSITLMAGRQAGPAGCYLATKLYCLNCSNTLVTAKSTQLQQLSVKESDRYSKQVVGFSGTLRGKQFVCTRKEN